MLVGVFYLESKYVKNPTTGDRYKDVGAFAGASIFIVFGNVVLARLLG